MREIKFRAWDKICKVIFCNEEIKITCNGVSLRDTVYGDYVQMEDDTVELMQGTGLKDKNGVNGEEIYQDDIIDERWKLLVYYKNGAFYVNVPHGESKKQMLLYDWLKHRIKAGIPSEIIGNLHENGDLLK
jgi:hypothetical protein